MSSSDIQGLTEAQVRRVLERLNSLNPDFVQSVMSNVLDEDSVVTQRASNTTRSSSAYQPMLPPPQVYVGDEEDAPPPPLRRATSDEGDAKPLVVSHESVRLKSDFDARYDRGDPSSGELKPQDDENPLGERAGCYLVEYDRQSGQLIMHYSLTPVKRALGVFYPAAGHSIVTYGKSPIVGVSDNQQNYCSGWCQFVLTAKALDGSMTVFPPLAVDLYLYSAQHETIQVVPEKVYEISSCLAVACLPKDAPFRTEHVDIVEWMANASLHGAANRF